MNKEVQSIVNDLDYIIKELNNCTSILQGNKGIGVEKCISSLNKSVTKYTKIKYKVMSVK